MLTKPREASKASNTSIYGRNQRRRRSSLMIIGISIPVLLALIGVAIVVVRPYIKSNAAPAVPNPNCTLIVPANPLSAQGLATPYQLFAPDAAANGPCNEANANQGAFVQATIYNPATGAFSVYSPLVIDQGTQPAVAPTVPTLPANAVVGIWFGFNGTNLTLQGVQGPNTLAQGQCVNGLNGSIFGQFAYCNAPNFFGAVNQGIARGLVKVPALATAKDGMPCPTTRDFSVVDQDQSDNVQTQYLANANGQIAQLTAANKAQLANATVLGNPSDNALLTKFIDPALGCQPWTAPDLANNNTPALSLALDEIMANRDQKAPVALVPLTDPMTLVNNAQSQDKTIAYRKGVDQNPGGILPTDGTTYCQNFVNTGLPRIKGDMTITVNATSPDPAAANSLFTFLANRFMQAYGLLNCPNLLNQPNPITVQTDGNGVVIAATITLPGTGNPGGVVQSAIGTATINLNKNAGSANVALNVTYANHPNQQINVNIATNSCTGKAIFTQMEDTNGQGMVNASTVINGLQNVKAIPNNWFFTVTDPAQNNQVVGCGSVTPNGTTGTATLGTVAAAAANNNAQVAAPASAGKTTAQNAPYKGKRRQNGQW
ncbi:MAG TPA: hypothetical protein VFB12_23950 [Ktedonobacteraceae bacterium]|nr:hypothetical protein [Ktedonobacteraceae bacterium]